MISSAAAIAALDREIARLSLSEYAKMVSPDIYRQPSQVLKLIQQLEALERGDIRRLIVEMPPRSSKSFHISRLFPSWWLGKHPDSGVILASYSDTLATDNGRAVRDHLSHPKYPFATKIRADVKAAGRWQTDQGGGLIAVGVGTGLTGWPFPGDLILVDDPVKGRVEADSQVVRDNTWAWWQETLLTRLSKTGVVILDGTRWHEDDLIGRVLNSAGASDWERLRIPYLAESNDVLGRLEGEPLDTFGMPLSVEKGEISAYGFAAVYQQRPAPAGGGVFKAEWMNRRYDTADLLRIKGGARWVVIQTVDLGGKQGVGHDPSAIATWGWDGISKYLLDYWSSHGEYVDIKQRIKAKNIEYQPRMLYVEDATWAQPLISDLRRESGIRVHAVPARGSKWTRADSISPEFEGGLVSLPQSAPWLDSWMHEHLSFPNAQHDEAVDTTSLALSILKSSAGIKRVVSLQEQELPEQSDPARRMLKRIKERRRG